MREKDDRFDRSQKEHEYQVSKMSRTYDTDKEALKRDYE